MLVIELLKLMADHWFFSIVVFSFYGLLSCCGK